MLWKEPMNRQATKKHGLFEDFMCAQKVNVCMRLERRGLDESSPYKDQKHIVASNVRNFGSII